MQFFEPDTYEDFTGKLSSIRVKPSPRIWQAISHHLNRRDAERKTLLFKRLSLAASFLILLGLSLYSYRTVNINYLNDAQLAMSIETSLPKAQLEALALTQEEYLIPTQTNTKKLTELSAIDFKPKLAQSIALQNIKPLHASLLAFNNTPKEQLPFLSHPPKYSAHTLPLSQPTKPSHSVVDEALSSSKGNWEIIGFINPTFSHHTTAMLNYQQNPNETGVWMWGGDVMVRKRLNKYFSIYSGLQISPLGQDNKNLVLLRSESVNRDMEVLSANTSYGLVSLENRVVAISNFSSLSYAPESVMKSSVVTPARLSQRFYYLEVPLMISTSVGNRFLELELKIGCSAGILVANNFSVVSSQGNFSGKTEDIMTYNVSGIGAASLSIPFNDNFSLILEPSLRLSLKPISNNHFATYPFSSSLKLGIGYRF